jgi:hypothetical protein
MITVKGWRALHLTVGVRGSAPQVNRNCATQTLAADPAARLYNECKGEPPPSALPRIREADLELPSRTLQFA